MAKADGSEYRLTTLYSSVSPRTVFEGDEIELVATISSRLKGMVSSDIPFKAVPFTGRRNSADVAMLKLSDLVAGQALEEEEEEEPADDEVSDDQDSASAIAAQTKKLKEQLERNVKVIKLLYGEARPTLWLFHQDELERALVEKSVELLFGDAVELKYEQLPAGTHGLKADLPGADLPAAGRFDLRVEKWRDAANLVKTSRVPYVLICASDREQGRTEDQVNYYAGIYAMCSIANANVHHVLPIAGGDPAKAQQHFVHRLQSALLDVFFAHSGVVFGTKDFLAPLFAGQPPKYVYGIQALRSNARSFSGEVNVSFLLFTRLSVDSGRTQVRFIYRQKHSTKWTEWLDFSKGLRWLGTQRQLDRDEPWLKDSASSEVRVRLGEIAQDDPRALVLVDWSSMASLWKGISDEDLTATGPLLNGHSISAVCPDMTLVRLRRDGRALALRTRNTFLYERLAREGVRLAGQGTGETYADSYVTTTKKIISLTPPKPSGKHVNSGHYIQSMKYRKTTQIVRGQSCYRRTERMKRREKSENVYELTLLDPSWDDAALPAPLEVTVMSAPKDVNPDNVAIAVLGMRVGYVHYAEWSALPAPLFFKRKVEDYLIRYRSPAAELSDEILEDETTAIEPDVDAAASSANADGSPLESEYVRESAEKVAESTGIFEAPLFQTPPKGDAGASATAALRESGSDSALADYSFESLCDDELDISPNIEDDKLLALAQRTARADIALCGRAARHRRHLYRRMLHGNIKVRVDVPSFVTPTAVCGSEFSVDRRTLKRFWHEQRDFDFLRRGEHMPPVVRFKEWIFRRLQMPQAGYSLFTSSTVFQVSLFAPAALGWARFAADTRAKNPQDEAVATLTPDKMERLDLMTQWAVSRADDDLVAWLVFGAAHFPMREVLDDVLPHVASPLGPKTSEALDYFVRSARAARRVFTQKPGSGNVPIVVVSARPSNSVIAAQTATEPRTESAVPAGEPIGAPVEHSSEADVVESIQNATDCPPAIRSLLEIAIRLAPGEEAFPSLLEALKIELSRLDAEHCRVVAERAEQAAEQLAREQTLAERESRSQTLRNSAVELIERMEHVLPDTQPWRVTVVNAAMFELEPAQHEFNALTDLIAAAETAQREYQTVSEQATPPLQLTPRDRARHVREWQEAVTKSVQTFESTLRLLEESVRQSTFFKMGDPRPSPSVPIPGNSESAGSTEKLDEALVLSTLPDDPAALEAQIPAASNTQKGLPTPFTQEAESFEAIEQIQDQELMAPLTGRALPEEDLDEQESVPENEVAKHQHRAEILSTLVDAQALPLGELYAECCFMIDQSSALVDDHWLIARAALESIRALREEIPPDHPCNRNLASRLEAEGLNTPGSEVLGVTLGIFAAALNEMLFPSLTGGARWTFIEWLRPRLQECMPLNALLNSIELLEGLNIAREVLTTSSIGERTQAQAAISRLRARARDWAADDSLYTNWTKRDYQTLHESLFRDLNHPIAQCLAAIAAGDDQRAETVFREARKALDNPTAAIERIAQRQNRKRSFQGAGRYHMQLNLERTLGFIKEYFEAVQRARGINAPLSAHARDALDALYRDIDTSIEFLNNTGLQSPQGMLYEKLAGLALKTVKNIFHGAKHETVPAVELALLLPLPMGHDLKPSILSQQDALGNSIPAIVDPIEVVEEIDGLARELKNNDGASEIWIRNQLEQAAKSHLANNRLLPLRAIDKRLSRLGGRLAEQSKLANLLSGDLQRERQRVTHAMALGALTQTEATRLLRSLEELLQAAPRLSDADSPEAYPDFPHAYVALRRVVEIPLKEKLAESQKEFLAELDQYLMDAPEREKVLADVDWIRQVAADSTVSGLRTARDFFSLLRREGSLPKRGIVADQDPAGEYKSFIATFKRDVHGNLPQVRELIRRLTAPPIAGDPECIAHLTENARLEATRFLENWLALCEMRSSERDETLLKEFFVSLAGLEPSLVKERGQASRGNRLDFSLNKPFVGLDRGVSGVFIPPSLGSEAHYVHCIVLKQRLSDTALGQVMEERGGADPTLILCPGSLTLEQRSTLSRHHPVILIDDDIVVYAALHPEKRLAALLRVALLTYFDNPYGDWGHPVPPEMFFGRLDERHRLANVKTAAVLFGGRRLGKSSLLDQLRSDARVSGGETVLYLPLSRAGHGSAEEHDFVAWDAIRRGMTHANVLAEPKREASNARDVQRFIETEIMQGRLKTKRLYLLIDEADELMSDDLEKKGSPFISSLIHLTEVVREKCALRFCIAGLHNLTRIASEENSAYGKFETIPLRSFWSAEGIKRGSDLIRVPLESLGYYFPRDREDMAYRIMAACSFYPAFIQLYCKRLLSHLRNRRDKGEPPTLIEEADLNAVEHDKDFLSEIRDKFKLNLALDKRYEAIALILAVEYYRDGTKSLTTSDVRELCELFAPAHFATTGPGGYEALLEEMDILTILERGAGGRYSLRTPNIAMMIGSRESVEQQLEALSVETPVQSRSRGEIRVPLIPSRADSRDRPLFPMPAAWVRSLFSAQDIDVGQSEEAGSRRLIILVGNECSGLSPVARAKGEAAIGDTASLTVSYFQSAHAARAALVRTARTTGSGMTRGRSLHCVPSGSWRVTELPEYARIAGTLAQRPAVAGSGISNIRLALIANPDQALDIAKQQSESSASSDWQVVQIPCWSDDAVYYYLKDTEQHELRHSANAREVILRASCGFGSEIERLCAAKYTVDDVSKALDDAERRLAPDLETFYRQLGFPHVLTNDLRHIEVLLPMLDGEKRESQATSEYPKECEVSPALFQYMQWMGLLQEASDGTWRVPVLYRRLLK